MSPKSRSRPGKPNQRKDQSEKFMNFAHFCEFWCSPLGKQARFTLNFCSGMPLRKVHELTFFWFGLPGPLVTKNSLNSVFETVLSETVFSPFPKNLGPSQEHSEAASSEPDLFFFFFARHF